MANRGATLARRRAPRALRGKVQCPTCKRQIADVVRDGRGKRLGTFCVVCWNAGKAGAVGDRP